MKKMSLKKVERISPKTIAVLIMAVLLVIIFPKSPVAVAGQTEINSDQIAKDAKAYNDYLGKNLKLREAVDENGKTIKKNQYKQAQEWIKKEMIAAGVKEDAIGEQNYSVIRSKKKYIGKNIIITVPGESNEKQIIVGAHYDGDGYGDNGSGIALQMAEIKYVMSLKLPYTVKFVFFDGEEFGMLGSFSYGKKMSKKEIKKTMLMVNMDSLVFGDYCNVYGGYQNVDKKKVTELQGYYLAVKTAKELGMKAYTPKDLDGYYKKHKKGPKIDENTIYTNPWTFNNPAPTNNFGFCVASPTTLDASDHVTFKQKHIPYIYFEATNWFAKGDNGPEAYSGYYETTNDKIGEHGMFMNTKYDTLKNAEKYFPGRAMKHFKLYGALLTKILMEPNLGPDKPSNY